MKISVILVSLIFGTASLAGGIGGKKRPKNFKYKLVAETPQNGMGRVDASKHVQFRGGKRALAFCFPSPPTDLPKLIDPKNVSVDSQGSYVRFTLHVDGTTLRSDGEEAVRLFFLRNGSTYENPPSKMVIQGKIKTAGIRLSPIPGYAVCAVTGNIQGTMQSAGS